MMFSMPKRSFVVYLLLVTLTVQNEAVDRRLRILPAQPVQEKAVGDSMLLTCNPDVPDRALISEFEWRDNKNRTVERSRSGRPNPAIYTDVLPSDPGLTLFISSLTEDMAGDYTCSANYASSETLVATVKIKTFFAIEWVDAPENQYPVVSTDYRIRCEVKANPAPSVDWIKNGEPIITGDRYVVESKGLLIRNVEESDDGIYACRAAVISTGQLVTRYIKVEVLIPPTVKPIEPVEFTEGDSANIVCQATGKPAPTYTWIKLPSNQDLAKADRFGVNKNTGTLVITKVEQGDHADYKCVAENPAGRSEQLVKINILVKPKIYEFTNITSPEGKITSIICKANGRPAPLITFRKFGSTKRYVNGAQPSDTRIVLEQKVDNNKGETVGELTINQLKRSDDGLYECIASNKGGDTFKNGHLTVEFKPTFINSKNQLPVWTWDKKPGNLSCLAESIPNATIEWKLNDIVIQNSSNFKIQGSGPQSFLIVYPNNDPRFYTKYKCIATNRLGKAEHLVELKQAKVPETIQQATLGVITATTIRFQIMGPPLYDGLPVKSFTVQYRKINEIDWLNAKNKTWSVDSPYIVEDLIPEQSYIFRFAARNEVGLGPWGANQEHTMSKRSTPSEPLILTTTEKGVANSPYADHFELRWRIPDDNGEPIDVYQIKYCQVRRVNGEWASSEICTTEEMTGQENPEFRMSDLTSDTFYKIELRAHNAIGYSTPAQLTIKTARGSDTAIYKSSEPVISSAAIIGIAVAAIIVLIIIVDLCCYCFAHQGILMAICEKTRKKPIDEEDAKLGREEKEPLKPQSEQSSVTNDTNKVSSTVEYDGRHVTSKTGEIIGKNSAV